MKKIDRKPIEGYEGLYEIDSSGIIYSIVTTSSRRKGPVKLQENRTGYLRVNLYDKNGKHKKYFVHRLVAKAFIPNPDSKPIVNHIDCNIKNNSVENLEWCTQSENIQYSYNLGRQANNIAKYNAKRREVVKCHV